MKITTEELWIGVGLIGQAMFFGRFLVQWIASERVGKSVIPVSFWFLSIAGGVIILIYSIYRLDPVFIIGNTTGVLIYGRNLMLLNREKRGGARVNPAGPKEDERVGAGATGLASGVGAIKGAGTPS